MTHNWNVEEIGTRRVLWADPAVRDLMANQVRESYIAYNGSVCQGSESNQNVASDKTV